MAEVAPNFLMDVFDLESLPQFLKSESTGLTVTINPSKLTPNDIYTVQGPGSDISQKRIQSENRNYGKNMFQELLG